MNQLFGLQHRSVRHLVSIDVDTLTMRMSAASILHSSCCVDITLNAILNHSSYEDD